MTDVKHYKRWGNDAWDHLFWLIEPAYSQFRKLKAKESDELAYVAILFQQEIRAKEGPGDLQRLPSEEVRNRGAGLGPAPRFLFTGVPENPNGCRLSLA